jgi:hypothetical protein
VHEILLGLFWESWKLRGLGVGHGRLCTRRRRHRDAYRVGGILANPLSRVNAKFLIQAKNSAGRQRATAGAGRNRPPRSRIVPDRRYFFSESRISRSRSTSSGGAGGTAGAAGASRFNRLIRFTIMKITNARMTKLIAAVMKLP